MTTEELINLVNDHLQEANADNEVRITRIQEIQDFLNYNLRLTELSAEEKEDFVNCMEGFPLTQAQRNTLSDAKGKVRNNGESLQDYYIDMWARSTYFKRCAWFSYLYGETKTKPTFIHAITSTKENNNILIHKLVINTGSVTVCDKMVILPGDEREPTRVTFFNDEVTCASCLSIINNKDK